MGGADIAIIGMGCVLPHANGVKQYWENVKSGDSYFSKMPERLWRLDNFHSEDRKRADKSYTTTGAFLEGFEFPFNEYRLPPNTMRGVDMAQLVTLEATREALDDAGIEPRSEALADAITLVGASGVDAFAHSTVFLRRHRYFRRLRAALLDRGVPEAKVDALRSQFDAELAARGHDWNPAIAAVGAIPSSISNRVAQVFGAGGFNMTLDAACASSFVALDVACQALAAGDTRLAIAGGADLGTNPAIYVGFSRVDGLSASGTSNPFDHTADGLIIGEGVGVVVVKRLEDALADGDRVRAVVRGIGTSSDGHGQAIYTPSASGRAMRAEDSGDIVCSRHSTAPASTSPVSPASWSTIPGRPIRIHAGIGPCVPFRLSWQRETSPRSQTSCPMTRAESRNAWASRAAARSISTFGPGAHPAAAPYA